MSDEIKSVRRVKCSNPNCDRTFCYVIDTGTIEIKRQKHQVLAVGKDFSVMGTCGWCKRKTTLTVVDGKLIEDGVTFKSDNKENTDGKEGKEGKPEDGGKDGQPTAEGDDAATGTEESGEGDDPAESDGGKPAEPTDGDESGTDKPAGERKFTSK